MTAVPHETQARLARLRKLVVAENAEQNLVARSSIAAIDVRHIDDSAQLIDLMPDGTTIDIGSGGGFPGLVVAILREQPITLVEPRKRRAAFLAKAASDLLLGNVNVHCGKVESLKMPMVRCITARAVASLAHLFDWASHIADAETVWVLPKGRTARIELEVARCSWQGEFMLHPSRTDPDASIVVARGIRRIAR